MWWIVAALVLLPTVVLAIAVAGLRLRLAELRRVADLARERGVTAGQRLTARAAAVTGTLVELERGLARLPRRTGERPGASRRR